ncbi:NUDIX domain-containing protein [Candidatus Uhrbacteria bacterium]|nr:NUDIX domain-containing protein [Candidatus Uhrbacteria bacterium]
MQDPRPIHAIVTAGGTFEPIDDIRGITNKSRGRLGLAIARALAQRDSRIRFLGGPFVRERPRPEERITDISFTSCVDLAGKLLAQPRPDLLFMAAAVADYTPIPEEGKIASDAGELTIRMVRNPKILPQLRGRFGKETFLVGFKLLSGASREQLITAAREQLRKCRTNLCVANDQQLVTRDRHPIIVVTPEGGAINFDGSAEEVAEALVAFVLQRMQVQWFHSTTTTQPRLGITIPEGKDPMVAAEQLLRFAQDAGLLTAAPDGNISLRDGTPRTPNTTNLLITPRHVPKDAITGADLIAARVDHDARRVDFSAERDDRKPSIDTGVHAELYRRFPWIHGFLHFHDAIVLLDAATAFPYPCGSYEEAAEIADALMENALVTDLHGDRQPFAVRLTHHGFLIGIEDGGVERLIREWQVARDAYLVHLREIGKTTLAEAVACHDDTVMTLSPIFASAQIIGVLAKHRSPEFVSAFLLPEHRNGGHGDFVLDQLDAHGYTIGAHDQCQVLGYYTDRGFRKIGMYEDIALLEPPSRRPDLRIAATACCYDPMTDQVLLGLRKTPPWLGYWAFPGGGIRANESIIAGLRRELSEELGNDPTEGADPYWTLETGVGDAEGNGYRVVVHYFLTTAHRMPCASEELDARWMPREEALQLRPMGAGTRRVLRMLKQEPTILRIHR